MKPDPLIASIESLPRGERAFAKRLYWLSGGRDGGLNLMIHNRYRRLPHGHRERVKLARDMRAGPWWHLQEPTCETI